MKTFRSVATASSLLVGLAAAQDVECQEGVHIIAARASGEAQGIGIIGGVVNGVLDKIPNSDAVAVKYPASINTPIYTISQPQGVGNMTDLITEYVDACPDGKIVLMGYSQGAHVTADVLLGNVNPEFGERPAIDSKYTQNLVAAILMGDPTFVVDQPINAGNSTTDGVFPRQNPDWQQDGFADKTQSYCDEGDFFCASGDGEDSLTIHIGYVPEYGDRAVDFVVSKYYDLVGGTPPSGTPSGTPSATPSRTASGIPSGTASPTPSGTPAPSATSTPSSTPPSTPSSSPSAAPSATGPASPPPFTGGAEQLKASSMMLAVLGFAAAMIL